MDTQLQLWEGWGMIQGAMDERARAMARDNGNNSRVAGLDPLSKIEAALGAGVSNLWGILRAEGDGGRCGVSLNCRNSRDWVAVLRASGPAGEPIVYFGNGESPVGALGKLNASIASGASRPDQFAQERAAARQGAGGPIQP